MTSLQSKNPISGYSFHLEIPGITDGADSKETFTSVEGLSKYVSQAKNHFYGGEQHLSYLPQNFATKDLVLKKPLMEGASPINDWVQLTLNTFEFEPRDMLLTISSSDDRILSKWEIFGGIPVAFDISSIGLDTINPIVYQIIIIKYKDVRMTTTPS